MPSLSAHRPHPARHVRTRRQFLVVLSAWAGGTAVLAGTGHVARLPTRLLPVPVLAGMGGLLAAYGRNRALRAWLDELDLGALTAFNVWRVPAALVFALDGPLPATFRRNAGVGDLVAGALALPTVAYVRRHPEHARSAYLAFHLFSFADFVSAVGTGFLFSLNRDPGMDTLKRLPAAVIPLFGVPVTGALSLIALRRLLSERRLDVAPTPRLAAADRGTRSSSRSA